MSPRRALLLLLPFAVASGLVPIWCNRHPAQLVQVAVARRAPLRVLVSTNGKVEPVDDIEVRARLDGRVVQIPDAGKTVAGGEEIVRLDDAPVATALAAAQAERLAALEALRAVRAEVMRLRQRFATDEKLFREGGLNRETYAASRAALADAEARLAFQEHDVPLRVASLERRITDLRDQLASAIVRAPFAGTIYKTAVKKGAMVRVGDPLLWLADLEHLRVRANVDQVDLGRVRPGERLLISANAIPGRSWNGLITEIIPNVIVKESRSVVEGLARLEPPTDGLVPGMTVDIEIVVAESENGLQVPADAVVTRGDRSLVYRYDGGRVHETVVRVGLSSITATEILEGLSDGDQVVVGPTAGLEDGARAEVRAAVATPP